MTLFFSKKLFAFSYSSKICLKVYSAPSVTTATLSLYDSIFSIKKFVIFYDKGKTETTGCIDILSYLREKNITVEIIEEKEIEKIGKIYDGFTDSYYDTCLETTIKKVDEIIDVVNKLKKEK